MPETKVLICKPTASEGCVVPGTLPDKCSKCGQPVWVSPSSFFIMQDNPGIAILCIPCAVAHIKKAKHPKIEDITPAQAEEIEEYFGKASN